MSSSPRPGGAVFAPPSRHHETKSLLTGPSRPRGAQPGNNNAVKHGFYTRRFKKRDVSGVEEINLKSLADEIALIRVLTRQLVEACGSSADLYDLAGVLRAVCLASTTITRVIKSHALLSSKASEFDDAVNQAIDEFWLERQANPPGDPPRVQE